MDKAEAEKKAKLRMITRNHHWYCACASCHFAYGSVAHRVGQTRVKKTRKPPAG
jgi:hypothetical protein